MNTIREYLLNGRYEEAHELLLQTEQKSEEYYICMAAAKEGLGELLEAQRTAAAGYDVFPDSYELVYMLANYSCFYGRAETAYAYYLLSGSLCGNDDRGRIEADRNCLEIGCLDVVRLQKVLEDIIRDRLEKRKYHSTYQFLSDIVYSRERFLFEKVVDKWFRYYYILLEITACEQNHGLAECAADVYKDWRSFEPVMCRVKFALRRIWFDFPQNAQNEIVQLTGEYGVSADFVAVLAKYSVYEDYLADVLERTANIFFINKEEDYAKILNAYSAWFRGIHAANQKAEQRENQDNGLQIIELDGANGEAAALSASGKTDENGIAYIMCANEPEYVAEAARYLRRQKLAEKMNIRLYVVYNAESMAAGYNLAMARSEERYKIYIHQDTFIFDEGYTMRLVSRLREAECAMLAPAGTVKMPAGGRWWESAPQDKRLCLYQDFTLHILKSAGRETPEGLQCPDGVLIATREDVRWREELFGHFHFYDVSQGFEFIKKGFKVGFFDNGGVPGVLHEDSVSKNVRSEELYEQARQIFIQEYL